MKILLSTSLIVLLVVSGFIVKGQDNYFEDNNTSFDAHFLGVNAGFTTGVGLSYRYWPGKSGFQISAIPIIDKHISVFSIGTTYLHELKRDNNFRFMLFASNHLTNMVYDNRLTENIGAGFGADIFYNSLGINVMIGVGAFDIFNDFKTRPTIETGMFFNF
jgi:hypothetical protein